MKNIKDNKLSKIKDSSVNSGDPDAIMNNDKATDNRFMKIIIIKSSINLDYNETYNNI